MKLFIFTFIIFSLGWWSSYVHNYLYEKYKENKRDNAIRKEIADNHDYYFFAESNKDIALGLEYALDIFDEHQKGGKE